MKFNTFISILGLFFFSFQVLAGKNKAPDFKLIAAETNAQVSLSDFKNKLIVLEWLNHGCPFIRKHYDGGNMQKLQKIYGDKGVVWLSIISSAVGKQGHVDVKDALRDKKRYQSHSTFILLDPQGKVGKLYKAKVTPHMFIISKEGEIVYQGAIDDQPDAEISSLKIAKNYVSQALDELLRDKKVSIKSTRPYGCSVKY